MFTTVIRQVWIPLTRTVSPEERLFAYNMPREREKFEARDAALKAAITKAESECEELFNGGFSVICDHIVNSAEGQFLHMLFVRRSREDDSE
jgi:hypothetical protein